MRPERHVCWALALGRLSRAKGSQAKTWEGRAGAGVSGKAAKLGKRLSGEAGARSAQGHESIFCKEDLELDPKVCGNPSKVNILQHSVQSKAQQSLDGALVRVKVQCSLFVLLLKPIQTHS